MNIFTPLAGAFLVIHLAILGVAIWAFVDAAIRPQPAYVAAGKQTKQTWLLILGVGLLFAWLGFLALASVIASIIYFVDVRPRVREFGSGPRTGPYGPW